MFYILHLVDKKIVGYPGLQMLSYIFAQILVRMDESKSLQLLVDGDDVGMRVLSRNLIGHLPEDATFAHTSLPCQHFDDVLPDKGAKHIQIMRTVYQSPHNFKS